ncbi:uncharacterized protein LOC117792297 [Drosophila innubila]|uniref:uncharacterized protein LOC117792297 n=1 Tax=Drosophila innubila TaxID=198719 RepID=UPI00148CDC2F|nr:uncharacterized protein LOC117792297 [Drosophila innubila]
MSTSTIVKTNANHEIVVHVEGRAQKTEDNSPLYYVENIHCKIPYIDPFAEEVMEIYKPHVFEECTNESDLVRPIFDMNIKRYMLHINDSVISQILNSSEIKYTCYYQEITHSDKNGISFINGFKLHSPVYFRHGYEIPPHVQAIILNCHEARNVSHVLQMDGYALVQYKSPPGAGAERGPEATEGVAKDSRKSQPRKPSVIMFGLDTMSRINLRRTMPKVYKFLTQTGWYEMQGYNKVADNTFPNLLAVLSGFSPKTAKKKVCDTDRYGCFERFPFIWKYLKEAGYLTAYAEDAFCINTFNLGKPGFSIPPTDYYHLLFLRAFEDQLKGWKCDECSMNYCYGRRVQSSYIFDYMKEFAKRYINDQPIWGLFWSSSFTHDDFSMPSKMDNYILQYFKDFETDGVLDENIVIFFSDHGARFGELRQLSSGFLESRLPMLFIYLPPWFREQYPEYARALELNRNRLTSSYDLHNTLKHIIEIGGLRNESVLPKSEDCPKCQSLFHPVDELRTCSDAGIPAHYCTCEPYKTINDKWTDRIAALVIERINEYLWSKNLSSCCENLTLNLTQNAEFKIGLDMKFHSEIRKMDKAQYHITFTVKQNGAIFFATVIYNSILDKVDIDVETISRLNEYNRDSYCINDKLAKLFCICKIELPMPPVFVDRKISRFIGGDKKITRFIGMRPPSVAKP